MKRRQLKLEEVSSWNGGYKFQLPSLYNELHSADSVNRIFPWLSEFGIFLMCRAFLALCVTSIACFEEASLLSFLFFRLLLFVLLPRTMV